MGGLRLLTRAVRTSGAGGPAARAELGADSEGVDGGAFGDERGDAMLVEVARGEDADLREAGFVEDVAHAASECREVAGIQPHGLDADALGPQLLRCRGR